MLKSKTGLVIVVVVALVVTGFVGVRFVFKKFTSSLRSKEDAAAQIRALNKTLNEYNGYSNSANQLNNSNTPL